MLFKTFSFSIIKKDGFFKVLFFSIVCCFSVNIESKNGKKTNCEIVFLRRLHTRKNDETFGKLLISKDGSTVV